MNPTRDRHDAMGPSGTIDIYQDSYDSVDRMLRVHAGVDEQRRKLLGYTEVVALRLNVPDYWVRIDMVRHRVTDDGEKYITVWWERAAFS